MRTLQAGPSLKRRWLDEGEGEEELMRIRVVTVYVTDQDKARAFYTEKLGL